MARKLSVSLVMLALVLVGCEKTKEMGKTSDQAPHKEKSVENPLDSVGMMHNNILDIYHQKYGINSYINFSTRFNLLDSVLAADYGISSGVSFVADSAREWFDELKTIDGHNYTFSGNRELLNNLHANGDLSDSVHSKLISLMDLLENSNSGSGFRTDLNALLQETINSNAITSSEKEKLYAVFAICKHSSLYWENLGLQWKTQNTSDAPRWFARDAGFASLAISTGLAEYTALVTGGWGGVAVIVGFAAVGSMT